MSGRGCRNRFTAVLVGLLGAAAAAPAPGEDDPGRIAAGSPTPSLRPALVNFDELAAAIAHEYNAAEPLASLSESLRLALAEGPDDATAPPDTARPRRLPFLGEEARKRGYDLPLPFGAGAVYYYLSRDIEVTEVRIGRNGAQVEPVRDFVSLGSKAEVHNANAKVDVWLLPFLNLYAIAGYISNVADTRLDLTLPPLVPGAEPRRRSLSFETSLEGTVGGLGVTLAGGHKQFFFAADVNAARADLGFDEELDALVASLRVGWNGKAGSRPLRLWLNATYWDTAAVAVGTVADPDGGTLAFEVDQGPIYPWTYGLGAQIDILPAFNLAADFGSDFNSGWYFVLVPVFRF
jgi:hypothetical protein